MICAGPEELLNLQALIPFKPASGRRSVKYGVQQKPWPTRRHPRLQCLPSHLCGHLALTGPNYWRPASHPRPQLRPFQRARWFHMQPHAILQAWPYLHHTHNSCHLASQNFPLIELRQTDTSPARWLAGKSPGRVPLSQFVEITPLTHLPGTQLGLWPATF